MHETLRNRPATPHFFRQTPNSPDLLLRSRASLSPASDVAGYFAPSHCSTSCARNRSLERETGIEPATNSLEGCDSTTELLPPCKSAVSYPPSALSQTSAAKAAFLPTLYGTTKVVPFPNTLPELPVPKALPKPPCRNLFHIQPNLMEPMIRIELMTSPLPRECSTN